MEHLIQKRLATKQNKKNFFVYVRNGVTDPRKKEKKPPVPRKVPNSRNSDGPQISGPSGSRRFSSGLVDPAVSGADATVAKPVQLSVDGGALLQRRRPQAGLGGRTGVDFINLHTKPNLVKFNFVSMYLYIFQIPEGPRLLSIISK
jgi:hypothetical protein